MRPGLDHRQRPGATARATARATTTFALDVSGLRWAGAAMIGLGVGLPLLPHNPGLACPLRAVTGVPCPLCGMTTAVKAGLAGHLGSSVAANPFGVVAILVAVALLARPRLRHLQVPVAALVAAAVASWAWELRRFGVW